jgi:peptidoglycan hydrolase CwlO-like protein
METISSFFSANPAAATLLAAVIVIMLAYFILKKLLKLAIVLIFVILLAGGIYFFKDPTATPEKIKNSVETLKTGSGQIKDKLSNLWTDTKELAGKAKEVPGDVNDMLDTARKDVEK